MTILCGFFFFSVRTQHKSTLSWCGQKNHIAKAPPWKACRFTNRHRKSRASRQRMWPGTMRSTRCVSCSLNGLISSSCFGSEARSSVKSATKPWSFCEWNKTSVCFHFFSTAVRMAIHSFEFVHLQNFWSCPGRKCSSFVVVVAFRLGLSKSWYGERKFEAAKMLTRVHVVIFEIVPPLSRTCCSVCFCHARHNPCSDELGSICRFLEIGLARSRTVHERGCARKPGQADAPTSEMEKSSRPVASLDA